jgi:hypothetical protein
MPVSVPAEDDARFIGYLRDGLTTNAIAEREQMSIHTVKSRFQRIYREYGARTRAQLLAAYADEQRLHRIRHDLINERVSQLLATWIDVNVGNVDGLLADALALAFDVRTAPSSQPRQRLARWLDRDPERVAAIVLTLAALVPLDRSPDLLLRWLTDRRQPTTRRPTRQSPSAVINGVDRADGSRPN